ncbi:SgcJ/EcaC family oxidoreductase [Isoptericola croceus]|uniref:SgcJ/EcaC family oxidoreductase n=1 Tax=Isoptericola croceus TaxID=3031406 RepID=UPI0023F8A535|nr:SgcJ/EcaC family oxidoreductase [Isoptericola croceus]
MKKTSVIVAGAALSALAFGAPVAVGAAAASAPQHVEVAQHAQVAKHGAQPTRATIDALFGQWNAAVESGDPEEVADLYASDAVLLPTLSPEVRTTRAGIVDYFEHFLAKNPSGERLQSYVTVLDGRSAIDTGVYRFTFTDEDGTTTFADARYTFVYEKQHGQWLIVNHHSSLLPDAS